MATKTPAGARGSGLPPSARATHTTPSGAGYLPSPLPHDLLAGVFTAHRRLLTLAAAVQNSPRPEEVIARPSLLPDWSVGQVLTHLARHADSHSRMFEAASAGAGPEHQYPGGRAQRDAEIQAGAGRPALAIGEDLTATIVRLERAWDATHVDIWRTGSGLCGDTPVSLADLVFLRWREVEMHTVDLGLTDLGGPAWADLPAHYVDTEWEWTTRDLARRIPADVSLLLAPGDRPSRAFGTGARRVIVRAPTVEALRWLTGRLSTAAAPADWPRLAPWE